MCGITGIIQADTTRYHHQHVQQMAHALAHRGPDGSQIWQSNSGHALLGHRRLSIIDLSPAAAQPMHYLGRYTIVHNGEIYNYIELRTELEKEGYRFHTRSDTEVILAAYDCWYDECPDHFDGMFAFAIWDEEEQELFAARDRFGEKPFYYTFDGSSLLFGSEMKALWAAGVPREPNLQLLFNFITIGYTDNPEQPAETFYTNIRKLPAASFLCWTPGEPDVYIQRYWDIDTRIKNKKIVDSEAIEQFSHLLSSSVQRRLRSDVSIGSSLSGGLDSSSIVALVSKLAGNGPQKTFTALFPGFEKDESFFLNEVARRFRPEEHTVTITAEGLLADWDRLCYHQEEPFGSAGIYGQYKVYERAAGEHVKVMLDGQGADETLAGYHKYYKWYWQELFIKRKLWRSGELKAARELGITERFGLQHVAASILPDLASVILERQYLLKALRNKELTKEFIRLQSKEAYYSTPALFNLNGALYFNTCTHGLEELLRYADRASMAHGCEVRLPFLDHTLVEFLFSLPSHFKIREGWTKWILRKSMDTKLPDTITWRRDKTGFESPQKQWMQHPVLQEAVREARKKLVEKQVLRKEVIDLPVRPLNSYDADNYDWRYLSAAAFL